MTLPDLTSLQFLVLDILGASERSGRYVREKMRESGASKTLAAFYQLMSRLEDCKFVVGSNHKIEVGGQTVTERRYRITGAGCKAYEQTREFYDRRSLRTLGNSGVSSA